MTVPPPASPSNVGSSLERWNWVDGKLWFTSVPDGVTAAFAAPREGFADYQAWALPTASFDPTTPSGKEVTLLALLVAPLDTAPTATGTASIGHLPVNAFPDADLRAQTRTVTRAVRNAQDYPDLYAAVDGLDLHSVDRREHRQAQGRWGPYAWRFTWSFGRATLVVGDSSTNLHREPLWSSTAIVKDVPLAATREQFTSLLLETLHRLQPAPFLYQFRPDRDFQPLVVPASHDEELVEDWLSTQPTVIAADTLEEALEKLEQVEASVGRVYLRFPIRTDRRRFPADRTPPSVRPAR
jgi:hypothetical protein